MKETIKNETLKKERNKKEYSLKERNKKEYNLKERKNKERKNSQRKNRQRKNVTCKLPPTISSGISGGIASVVRLMVARLVPGGLLAALLPSPSLCPSMLCVLGAHLHFHLSPPHSCLEVTLYLAFCNYSG